MGKYLTLGGFIAIILGFFAYFALAFSGDFSNNSMNEPINSTMTVGEMRLSPYRNSPDFFDDEDISPGHRRGVRAKDLIAEVTNELLKGKPANTIYLIDWTLKETGGSVKYNTDSILNGDENPVLEYAEYTVRRYDATQVDDEGNIVDEDSPVNSTSYKWSVYTDESARTSQPFGLGGGEDNVVFSYYTDNFDGETFISDYDDFGGTNTEGLNRNLGSNVYGESRGNDIKSLSR